MLFLPGSSGAGGIINWGGRVQNFFLPGGSGAGGIISWGGRVQNHFSDLTLFFDIQFKNTYNLILLGFKLSSERFLFKDFKTDLTFWHMWFFNFQNLVRSCKHIDGTPCIWNPDRKKVRMTKLFPYKVVKEFHISQMAILCHINFSHCKNRFWTWLDI